jgi:hypothetical protein
MRTRMPQVAYEQIGSLSYKVYKKSQGRQKVPLLAWPSFHTLVCGAVLLDKPRDT